MSLRRKTLKFLMSMIDRKMIFIPRPPVEDPDKPVIEPLVKAQALKKMADLFRRWKNELKPTFVDKGKTPEFTRQFEKIRDHRAALVPTRHRRRVRRCQRQTR